MADEIKKINVTSAVSDAVAATADDDIFAETKSELVSRFELLPEEIKKVIMDAGYQKTLFDLAKTEKLTYEELGTLETETTMVLLGMTKPAEYRSELEQELKKSSAQTDSIVKAVNEQVFTPIRAALERLYAAKKEPEDYIATDIMRGVEPKPAAPIFEQAPVQNAIHGTIGSMSAPQVLTSAEKNVLEKTGVVITPTPTPTPSAPVSELGNRAAMLAGIENPSSIAPNIVAAKLNVAGAVMSATKSTDYSVPKTQAPATSTTQSTKPTSDPYREPIN